MEEEAAKEEEGIRIATKTRDKEETTIPPLEADLKATTTGGMTNREKASMITSTWLTKVKIPGEVRPQSNKFFKTAWLLLAETSKTGPFKMISGSRTSLLLMRTFID